MFENFKDHEVPVDFFKVDLEKFPFAKYVSFIDVELKAGDCLYVPAFFYLQSQTMAEETVMITLQYAPHSQILDMIFNGLDSQIIGDDNKNEFDKMLQGYFNNLY